MVVGKAFALLFESDRGSLTGIMGLGRGLSRDHNEERTSKGNDRRGLL